MLPQFQQTLLKIAEDMKSKAESGKLCPIKPLEKQGHIKILENVLETGGICTEDDVISINASDKAINALDKQIGKHQADITLALRMG